LPGHEGAKALVGAPCAQLTGHLQFPAGSPTGRVTVAITPAEEAAPTGRRLLAKLLDLQAAIPAAQGFSQEQIDTALEQERAGWR
jgi:hypothetical protein